MKKIRTKKELARYLSDVISDCEEQMKVFAEDESQQHELRGMKALAEKVKTAYLGEVSTKDSPEEKLFKSCIAIHSKWLLEAHELHPKYEPSDYVSMREIIEYLGPLCRNDNETVKKAWKSILQYWDNYPDYIKNWIKIRQINKNIFDIIKEFKKRPKNVKTTTKAEQQISDFREIAKQYFKPDKHHTDQ